MTAFLKIDTCRTCQRLLPWEFVPAVMVSAKALLGTGVWRSQLLDGQCPACLASLELQRQRDRDALVRRTTLITLLGGEKAHREFTFERYQVTSGNRLAYERARQFSPATDNLYLWGPCGVGKTHLVYAIARRVFEESLMVSIEWAPLLARNVRMKEPAQEQAALDHFAAAEVLVLDDLAAGPDTAFSRQIVQEILDRRNFADRAGLVITSKYSLDDLAAKMADDSIASRLGGMCQVVEVRGRDFRLRRLADPQ